MVERVGLGALQGLPEPPVRNEKASDGFAELLENAVRSVEARKADADEGVRGMATGENVDIHGTMIALEEANITMRAMVSVRDKVVEAYQTIWNMPI